MKYIYVKKHSIILISIFIIIMNLNACFMMPLMLVPMMKHDEVDSNGQSEKYNHIEKLIKESVADIDAVTKEFGVLYIGDIEISNNLISIEETKSIYLKELKKKDIWRIVNIERKIRGEKQDIKEVRLNTKICNTDGRIKLTNQILYGYNNTVYWSGSYSTSLP